MRRNKIRILHVAQAAGGVDRYIRMLLKYLDKDKFENVLVCSQDFHREDYDGLADSFEQIKMNRAIGMSDLNSIRAVRKLIKKYSPDIVYAHSSTGTQYYSYTYVADAVAGFLTVILKGESGEAYNIADEASDIMLKDLAKIIADFAGKEVVFELPDETEKAGYSKATKARLDGSKLKKLGWTARYDIKQGLERTMKMLTEISE